MPGITHWNHPGFFAYFAISGSGPGVLAEMLAAGLNVQAMLWRTSPSATELEEVALGWLRDLMQLPPAFEGVIYDTASVAVLHALAAAREAVIADVRTKGLLGRPDVPRVRVYLSAHTHSSADKSVILLGLGKDAIAHIPGDAQHAMRVDLLREAIAADRRAGIVPLAVIATIGTTSSTAIDPVNEIADLCEAEGIWLHVDAAYAGVMAMLPAWRAAFRGAERADTLVVNPHKWLFTPFDCSVLYCRRMDVLRQAFSLVAEYLKTTEAAPVKNLMDTGIQLGRRFRALKLWMVLRYFGAAGIRRRLEAHVDLARMFAGWVDDDRRVGAAGARCPSASSASAIGRRAPTTRRLSNGTTPRSWSAVNASGEAFLSHTKLDGRYVLRLADRQHSHRRAPRPARLGAADRSSGRLIPSKERSDETTDGPRPRCRWPCCPLRPWPARMASSRPSSA